MTRLCIVLAAAMAVALAGTGAYAQGKADLPELRDLRALHASVASQLAISPLKAPILITSHETDGALAGQVVAVIDAPFDAMRQAMTSPATWCEILSLHLNTHRCEAVRAPSPRIRMAVARKHSHSVDRAQMLDFAWTLEADTPARLSVVLDTPNGPLGTSNYSVRYSAMPLNARQSFVVFEYACQFNAGARLAMKAYLSTFGSGKVGFSPAADGRGNIGGMRGVIERTAMRYYLAIDAWFDAARQPAPVRAPHRFERWFDLTEKYPQQLRELSREEYLAAKRANYPAMLAKKPDTRPDMTPDAKPVTTP